MVLVGVGGWHGSDLAPQVHGEEWADPESLLAEDRAKGWADPESLLAEDRAKGWTDPESLLAEDRAKGWADLPPGPALPLHYG